MIRHIVIWKLRDPENEAEKIARIASGLEGLVGQIDGLISAKVSRGTGSDGYSVMLDSILRDKAALDLYQDHPLHVAQKKVIGEYTSGRFAFDYEMDYIEKAVAEDPPPLCAAQGTAQ